MCGIAGIYAYGAEASPPTASLIDAMRDTMLHRGPDGAGTWISDDGRVGLGHRRLSIIDLSDAAGQPMGDGGGNVRVVFNGEIYNHVELRFELERLGHRFRTDHSDTEVVVRGFLEWGIGCLDRFRGMFAFALWDARQRELWLVRDRIGIKPLYYSIRNGRVSFASEIKALLADPEQKREIDEEALFHYLSFLAVPAPRTMFEGIRKLHGGTWLKIDAAGVLQEKRYWDAFDGERSQVGLSDDELAGSVLQGLRDAVSLHKIGDVPVGVFLSGGVDSSANAALFSEGDGQPVRTFSVGYDQDYGSYRDELSYARDVASRLGADHHEIKLNRGDLDAFLPRMVALQDEPIADPVCVPLYYVAKLARDSGVTVCQVGEGADELFCGYPAWKRSLVRQRLDDAMPVPKFLKKLIYRVLSLAGQDHTQTAEHLRRASMGQPLFWGGAEAFTHADKWRLLSPRLREKYRGKTSWSVIEPIYRRFLNKAPEKSTLDWMTFLDLNLRLPELLLMRVDKMSMAVSLEARVPFLDHRFVEIAMGMPEAAKIRNGTLKSLLKKAVRGIVPDAIIDRPKQGFGLPLHEWLLDGLGEDARRHVDAFVAQTGLLDPRGVQRIFERKRGDVRVWYLLNLALWWEHFIKGEEPPPAGAKAPSRP
ncbi:MAG: asparagine synthase (glutamine-hydrolyzing) [Pseudomonadota bacterium]